MTPGPPPGVASASLADIAQAPPYPRTDATHALLDAMPDAASVLDWNGTVLQVNAAAVAALRQPREAIVGKPLDALHPDLPRDFLAPLHDALDRGETHLVEATYLRGDGTRFPVEVRSTRMTVDGTPCILSLARDLSDRTQADVHYRELMEVVENTEHEIGWSSDLELALDVIGGRTCGHHRYEKDQDTRNTDEPRGHSLGSDGVGKRS